MLEEFKKKLKEDGGIYLRIKVRPNAGKNSLKEIRNDDVKINIGAPAEKGKANMELIKFLSKEFCVPRKNVIIVSGAAERVKLIKIIK